MKNLIWHLAVLLATLVLIIYFNRVLWVITFLLLPVYSQCEKDLRK